MEWLMGSILHRNSSIKAWKLK